MAMKKNKKKKFPKKRRIKKETKSTSILPVLFVVLLLSLFSETVRTLPAGAFSEKISDMPYKLPKLNSSLVEAKLLKKDDYQQIREKLIFEKLSKKEIKAEDDIQNLQTQVNETELKKKEKRPSKRRDCSRTGYSWRKW